MPTLTRLGQGGVETLELLNDCLKFFECLLERLLCVGARKSYDIERFSLVRIDAPSAMNQLVSLQSCRVSLRDPSPYCRDRLRVDFGGSDNIVFDKLQPNLKVQ